MAVSMYAIAVPTFQKQLTALDAILDKATEYAAAKKIDISVLLTARLYPDMFNLTRQVQLATDFAKAAPARLAGTPVPSFPDTETTMPEIKQRIAKTLALLADVKPEQLNGSETKQLTVNVGGKEVTLTGQDYLLHVSFPNFYFHCATLTTSCGTTALRLASATSFAGKADRLGVRASAADLQLDGRAGITYSDACDNGRSKWRPSLSGLRE